MPTTTSTRRDGEYHGRPSWTRVVSMVTCPETTIVASAIPVTPPADWFDNPRFSALTGMTVDDSGRVSGHIAGWKQSHIGMAGSVRAPRSRSDYAFFKSGVIHCDDGSKVDVGQITLTGGHAPLTADAASAVKHYDDTQSAVMDVNVGEDKHGIWVAGALRPDVTPAQIRAIRASGVSGDWRPINGRNELVAVCSVPVPGFPIPRTMVAGGQLTAIVAAGSEELVELAIARSNEDAIEQGITAGLVALADRVKNLEAVVLKSAVDARVDADGIVAAADGVDDLEERRAELRQRVRPVVASADDRADDLRRRVHGDAVRSAR